MSAPMTDRERLEAIERKVLDEQNRLEQYMLMDDKVWLIETLKKYMDEQETVRKQYKLFCRTIREYDKLMFERRKELDVYNKEHPKG